VDVVLKDIKNIHLSVYPPVGKVRIAASFKCHGAGKMGHYFN
jgi:hypothetical protein